MLAVMLSLLASAAPPQDRNERHAALGLSLVVPRTYAPMPVEPTEEFVQLRYRGKESARGVRPDLYVLRIEWGAEDAAEPAKGAAPKDGEKPPIRSFASFLEQRMEDWGLEGTRETKPVDGWVVLEHSLEYLGKYEGGRVEKRESPWAAWALERQDGSRSYVVLGFCDREDLEKHVKLWRQVGNKLKFFAPTAAADEEKWARFYRFHPEFENGELRTRLRSRLLDGWDWEDTAHFVFLSSTDKSALMRDLHKKLEGMREHFLGRFPPVAPITAVSTVRVCKDKEEYVEYGGSARSAGYWNSAAGELVLYEKGRDDTRITLYHEAFHQYVYYAVGEVAPHPWFNEGYGDYFSGTEFSANGDVLRIRTNPWRVEAIRYFVGKCPPWSELIRMDQKAFMAQAEMHYPMSWSIVYFLEESKDARADPGWGKILPTYYETLRKAFTRERARLAEKGKAADETELEAASKLAREEAVTAAFAGIDLAKIESAWKGFVFDLKVPK